MQLNNPNPSQMSLDNTDQIPMKSRREQSKERQEKFYEELAKAHSEDQESTASETEIVQKHLEEDEEEPESTQESTQVEDDALSSKTIPKKRLDKEIENRKALEEELRRERDERIKLKTELDLYNKAIESLQKEPQSQDVEIDPVDADAHNLYMREINDLKKQVQNQTKHTSESEQRQRFETTVNAQAAQLSASNPDFNDAYSYLLAVKVKEAELQGYEGTEAQQAALASIQPIAWQVFNKGGNVAEAAYKLAQNYGYKTTAAKKVSNSPDLDKVSKNMAKSHTILDEIPGVSTSIAPEHAAYNTLDGFKQKLAGKHGRGTNVDAFKQAIDKLRKNG